MLLPAAWRGGPPGRGAPQHLGTAQTGGIDVATSSCEDCKFRATYDRNPKSLLGRLWRWHAGWCPGFKSYLLSLPDAERRKVAETYKMPKYM
jgi:hypothetical protein